MSFANVLNGSLASGWLPWILPLVLVLCSSSSPGAQSQERLWVIDVNAEGPLEGIVFDNGASGSTTLELELLAGERRSLRIPISAQVPLGKESLAGIPLPSARTLSGSSGSVQVLGWSDLQPAAILERLPPGLRARATPAVANAVRHASGAGLMLLTFAFVGGLFLRRRRYLGIMAGLLVGIALIGVAAREGEPNTQTVVVEADLTRDIWVEVRASRHELEGSFDSLRIEPQGGPMDLRMAGVGQNQRSALVARAQGKVLVGRRLLAGPRRDIAARRNQLGDFQASFLREPGGRWSAHGAWKAGDALPDALSPGEVGRGVSYADGGAGEWSAPPGWLAAGLPPGEWALLGRLKDGRWVRATGFSVEGESGETR